MAIREKQPLTLTRGETAAVPVTLTDTDGAAYDLTGKEVRWTVRTAAGASGAALIYKSSANAGEIDIAADPTTGICTINVDSADTESMTPGVFSHDVWVYESGLPYPAVPSSTLILSERTR